MICSFKSLNCYFGIPTMSPVDYPHCSQQKNKNTKGRHSSKTKNKVTIKKINKLEFIKKATHTNTSEWLLFLYQTSLR